MNQQQRTQIGEIWLGLAAIYGKEIQRPALKILLDSVSDLDPVKVIHFLNEWPKVNKTGRHPYPSEVRSAINVEPESKDVANELARKIDKAISRYGYTWEQGYYHSTGNYWEGGGAHHISFKDAVIAELGEIGWHVICARGGWQRLRESANEMQEGQFIAQLRDQVQASYNLKKSGIDISQIALPSSSQGVEQNNVLKLITGLK